ncbi:hypothetical protein VNO80_31460 [Phaseolus coccineus]|uniref:Uncharacterized protein n=1 Tax=Phaseolus coccineus TaxID=3886 RepID=A0AAN9L3Q7_PHACN
MLSQLFVFHKSKNFTSDYEIRMPPTVPVNHYSDPEGQHNRIRILWCYPMLMYPERRLCFEHSNFFKVTAPEARPRPVKARSASPAEGTTRPVHTRGGPIDPTQAVSQAPSPESNPNSPSPVTTMVASIRVAPAPARGGSGYVARCQHTRPSHIADRESSKVGCNLLSRTARVATP